MSLRIYQLPPAIANQIAAGEVIERPASVVKELLENTLDAEASAVSIDIGYGGLNYIHISDNGLGIMADDLPLALAAHATSKIRQLDDLYAISSMGFRGEALASIASIAKVTLLSKPASQAHAMQIKALDGKQQISPSARANGTTVQVEDLFYNAPVRKRFLKSDKQEFQAIETLVKRFALSAPHVELTLKHNGKTSLFLPAALNDKAKVVRMAKLFGSGFMREAIALEVEQGEMHLSGWLSSPQFQRSQNDRMWVYINQRMVKDKLLYHAIKQAYDGKLHPGRFPVGLLYVTIPSAAVDVNVHPTKHEVRFQQPRLVHDFILSAIRKALEGRQEEEAVVYHSAVIKHSPMQSLPLQIKSAWQVIEAQYAFLPIQGLTYLVDTKALQQEYFQELLLKEPPAKRPLLLPIRLSCTEEERVLLQACQSLAAEVALELDCSAEEKVVLRSIPQCLPQLNCHQLMANIQASKPKTREALLQVLSSSHCRDFAEMDAEEQLALQEWLEQRLHQKIPSYCRVIKAQDCKRYLYG